MQFQQLKYFVSLVEQQSYTSAARECLITQPALSQQIRILEQEMNVPLVKKAGRSFVITAAGQYLYKRAVKILQEVDELSLQVKRVGTNVGSTFRVGMLSSMDCNFLVETLSQEILNLSGLELMIEFGSHGELLQSFNDGMLKAFISEEDRIEEANSFNKVRLFSTKIYLELSNSTQVKYTGVKKLKIDSTELSNISRLLFVCKDEYLEEEQNALRSLLKFPTLQIEAVNSIEEGRKRVLNEINTGLIVDRSLMRGDSTSTLSFKRYELQHKGKSIKRHLCCYARYNLNFADLNDLYNCLMAHGTKTYHKRSRIELLKAKDNTMPSPL